MWEGHHLCCQPDSWPRWLQRLAHLHQVRRSQPEEALTDHWRQSPLEGIPPGWKGKDDQEVPAWHSCSLGDPAVPKEHQAPHQETPLLTVSP